MVLDAFEDNKNCNVNGETCAHGAEACDGQKRNCKICIDGWWTDKVQGHRGY